MGGLCEKSSMSATLLACLPSQLYQHGCRALSVVVPMGHSNKCYVTSLQSNWEKSEGPFSSIPSPGLRKKARVRAVDSGRVLGMASDVYVFQGKCRIRAAGPPSRRASQSVGPCIHGPEGWYCRSWGRVPWTSPSSGRSTSSSLIFKPWPRPCPPQPQYSRHTSVECR